jgi:membrane-bound ClpP family serine protease
MRCPVALGALSPRNVWVRDTRGHAELATWWTYRIVVLMLDAGSLGEKRGLADCIVLLATVPQVRPMTIGASIFLIALGASLAFAVEVTVAGFEIQTAGVILMVAGAVGLVIGLFLLSSRRASSAERTVHEDRAGRTVYEDRPLYR